MVGRPSSPWLGASLGLLLPLLSLAGCVDPCADGTILQSEGGLEVTQSEHPDGWGRSSCTACHNLDLIHTRSCTEGVNWDRLDDLIDEEGLDACSGCHGGNGVER